MVSLETDLSSSGSEESGQKRRGRAARRKPLDQTSLRDLALSYAARFATTGAKLEAYLARKIRERGVAEDVDGRTLELDVPALVERLIELGYVNDDAYARMRSRDLTARGYGKRRVEQALWAAGVDEEVRAANAPGEWEGRRAAVLLARKRGFGLFGNKLDPDLPPETRRAAKEKQIAAMLRAGHGFEMVRFILDASREDEIDAWLAEAEAEASEAGEGNEIW